LWHLDVSHKSQRVHRDGAPNGAGTRPVTPRRAFRRSWARLPGKVGTLMP
jgi:hypothetical protein